MEEFKKLEYTDRELIESYLGDYNFKTYEYSFLTLYMWRKMLNIEFSIIDDSLIIKKAYDKIGSYFMQPVGYKKEKLKDIILKLEAIKTKSGDFKNLLRDVEYPFLNELREIFDRNIRCCEDVNNFDYIHNSEDLISLSGRKFHSKKNHYNQFINSYKYEIKDLNDPKVVQDCIELSRTWFYERAEDDTFLEHELLAIEDVLPKSEMLGLKGIAVYVGDSIAGFAAGEKLNKDMAVIHFEKGDISFDGIYSFLGKTFVENYFIDVKYINRQEDMGVKGLRRAKRGYNPIKLERKYIVDLL